MCKANSVTGYGQGDAGGRERDFDQQEAQADDGAASAVTPARHDMQRALMAK